MVCTPVSLTHSRPLWTSSLHGGLSFLHPCSLHSLNAPRNFLCDIISSPSYDVLASVIFASSPVSFIFSQLPPLVRARVLSDTGASRVGSHLPYVMSHTLDGSLLPFRKGMAINLPCYAKYLKCCIIHFSLPSIKSCGGYSVIFRGPLLCTSGQTQTGNAGHRLLAVPVRTNSLFVRVPPFLEQCQASNGFVRLD